MRQRLEPEALAVCLEQHAGADLDNAIKTLRSFLDGTEMPGAAVMNLKAGLKQMETARSHIAAAALIAQREVS
jgi:hypothetical protein